MVQRTQVCFYLTLEYIFQKKIVKDVIGENHGKVSVNKKGTLTLPWPTRNNEPVSEFTTQYFFTLSFTALFPYGTGDVFLLIDQGLLHR